MPGQQAYLARISRLARGRTGDDQAVRQKKFTSVGHIQQRQVGRDRMRAVFFLDIRNDSNVASFPLIATAHQLTGAALNPAFVGDVGISKALNPNKAGPAGQRHGQSLLIGRRQDLNSQRELDRATYLVTQHGHGRHRLGSDSISNHVGSVIHVLQQQPVKARLLVEDGLLDSSVQYCPQIPTPSRGSRQWANMDHSDQRRALTKQR